ncbi:MAG: galactokinase [Kiritimatiellia bacterium]
MIITQTPFRITLGGGGTDLPSFYEEHGGYVFSMTINKYMYLMLNRRSVADRKIVIRYSQEETVDHIEEIKHPLARECLRLLGVHENIELTSIADLPARTGMGSSGSYLVGLLTALRAYMRQPALPEVVAADACRIEMDILKEPVGKQDQYMAALGGFCVLSIDRKGKVDVERVPVSFTTCAELVSKARIYYTGVQRSATAVLKQQDQAARQKNSADHASVVDALCQIKELGKTIYEAMIQGDCDEFGRAMDRHWLLKKKLSRSVSLSTLDDLYETVKKDYGVLGGKLIGAGGGGFYMLYCPSRGRELDEFMARHDMMRVDYFPSFDGSKVIADVSDAQVH